MKKFLKYAFVAVFAAIVGCGVYASQKSDTMSDFMLANVEHWLITERVVAPIYTAVVMQGYVWLL